MNFLARSTYRLWAPLRRGYGRHETPPGCRYCDRDWCRYADDYQAHGGY